MLSKIDLQISNLENELGLQTAKYESCEGNEELHNIYQSWTNTDTTLFVGDNLVYLKELATTHQRL